MLNLIQQFDKRREFLRTMPHHDAGPRLSDFLVWMESETETKAILDEIRAHVDIRSIIERCNHINPPKVSSPEEMAALGLLLMKKCYEGKDLHRLATNWGIEPSYPTTNTQDISDEAVTRYIDPTLDHIGDLLQEVTKTVTVQAAIDQHLAAVTYSLLQERCPATAERLQKTAATLGRSDQNTEWSNVGNSCRETLKTFTTELREAGAISVLGELKAADVKGIVKAAFAESGVSKRFRETLVQLVAAVWDHCQCITHRTSTSKEEAFRLFLWTSFSISEVVIALEEQDKRK